METVRVFFSKRGRLKYIGHLDLMRCVSRSLVRSGLPVWFTEGFSPHPYLTFALPLPLGIESRAESFDFRLTGPADPSAVRERLNALFPPDLRALRAAPPRMKPREIAFADYRMRVPDSPPDDGQTASLRSFLARASVPVIRKTKRGETAVDLMRHLTVLALGKDDGEAVLDFRLPAGETLHVSPTLMRDAYLSLASPKPLYVRMERTAVRTRDLLPFG